MTDSTPVNGPLDPEIRPLLDPEFVEFYEKFGAQRTALHLVPWDPACRVGPINFGGLEPCKVGSVRDLVVPGKVDVPVRVFTPEGEKPKGGWPVLAYFHGGGWVLGNIDTENSFSARACKNSKCAVVSVDYRLAPEDPFPAAIDDSWTVIEWIHEHGSKELEINPLKIAVGGSSAGGNISAVLTQRAVQRNPPLPIIYQVLIVPVTDNAIEEDGSSPLPAFYESWVKLKNTVALGPARMLWFRNYYLPNKEDRTHPDASPIYQKDPKVWAALPDAWVGVAELDILSDEGKLYARKLTEAGKTVDLVVYPGSPHPIMAMDEVLKVGYRLGEDATRALHKAFYGEAP
ncbi:hypothetical protein FRC12_008118 [Ceratobasidium sp. 428]|nr:hypothetical protein FRC12_008118 [Ceratobasidium sp. 428]